MSSPLREHARKNSLPVNLIQPRRRLSISSDKTKRTISPVARTTFVNEGTEDGLKVMVRRRSYAPTPEQEALMEKQAKQKKMRDKYQKRYQIDDNDSLNGDEEDLATPRSEASNNEEQESEEVSSGESDIEDTLLSIDINEEDEPEQVEEKRILSTIDEMEFFKKMSEEPVDDLDVFAKLDDLQVQQETLRSMDVEKFIDILGDYKMLNWDILKEQHRVHRHTIDEEARGMAYILNGGASIDCVSNDALHKLKVSPLEAAYALVGIPFKEVDQSETVSLPRSLLSFVRETVGRVMSTFFISMNVDEEKASVGEPVRVFVDLSYGQIEPMVHKLLLEQFLKVKQLSTPVSQELWQQKRVFKEIKQQWERREVLLIKVCKEKLSRLNEELKHRDTECVVLAEQLNKLNETLGQVSAEYGNDYHQLKQHLLQKLKKGTSSSNLLAGGSKLKESSKEITMLSSMGNSLSTQLTQLLEEERNNGAKSLLKLHKKFEKEKKEMFQTYENDLLDWKKRLFDTVNQKQKEESEFKAKMAKQEERVLRFKEKLTLANDKIIYLSKLARDSMVAARKSKKAPIPHRVKQSPGTPDETEEDFDSMEEIERSKALKSARDKLVRQLIEIQMKLNNRKIDELEKATLEKHIVHELDDPMSSEEEEEEEPETVEEEQTQPQEKQEEKKEKPKRKRPRLFTSLLLLENRKNKPSKSIIETKRSALEMKVAELSILCKNQTSRILTMEIRIAQLTKKLETAMKVGRELRKKDKEQAVANKSMEISLTQTKKKMETNHFQLEAAKDTIEANERVLNALREENRVLSDQLWRERNAIKKPDEDITTGSRRRVSMLLAMQQKKRNQTKALLEIKDTDPTEEDLKKLRQFSPSRRASLSYTPTKKKRKEESPVDDKERIKELEGEVEELQDQVDDFIVSMDGIDIEAVNRLNDAVEEAEAFDDQLTERLHGWDQMLSEKLNRPRVVIKKEEEKPELPIINALTPTNDEPKKKLQINTKFSPYRDKKLNSPVRPSPKEMYKKQLDKLRKKDEPTPTKKEPKIEYEFHPDSPVNEEERQRRGDMAEQRLIEGFNESPTNTNDEEHWMIDEENDKELFRTSKPSSPTVLTLKLPKKKKKEVTEQPVEKKNLTIDVPTSATSPLASPMGRRPSRSLQRQFAHEISQLKEMKKEAPSMNRDIEFELGDKVMTMSQALDVILNNLELEEELSERDRKVLSLIRTKKQNLDMLRQKKWGKVLNIAKQLSEFRNNGVTGRPHTAVPLSITTINDFWDMELPDEKIHHNALPSSFTAMQNTVSSPTVAHRTFVRSRPATSHDVRTPVDPLPPRPVSRLTSLTVGTPVADLERGRPQTTANLSRIGLKKMDRNGVMSVPTPTQQQMKF